ncbi:branched-chain amino acid ABC transporter permease [Limobrevibacterium gyesilva]|uniref:Branched-chain amino acid ABC transporter permease n=1 Tax=Limobrevibacterium gyesilva TaxID=2991712 RepID=A0AA41YMV2_9PROT|nr:branched-chain amino acid ABC transporter permease [Limobrevibacterium gyesilva]MCW3476424.1 branched-chain amino acid ABC transporter permease [Limobrevibacterium gyesilva]
MNAAHRASAAAALAAATRWRPAEFVFWAAAAASWFLLPDQYLLLNEVAIFGLFALSLDLALGYGGIVSLGHAAFFGFGAYLAGLLAKWGIGDPLLGLAAAGVASMLLGFATSFLVLRGSDLTRIMVTLSVSLVLFEVANRLTWLTGGADGLQGVVMAPILGRFEFDMFGRVGYAYSLSVLFVLFLIARRIMSSPFGLSVRAVKGNALRTAAIGIPVTGRLVAIYTLAAAYAGIAGALLAQSTQFVSLDVLAFHRSADVLLMLVIGGVGYLYGGIVGALLFKVMQDWLSGLTPQYWQFWIGLLLVLLVVVGRERIFGWPLALWRRVAGRRA